jgi:amino acid transporter
MQPAAVENGPGLVFGGLAEHWSPFVGDIANVLFLTSVFAALLSFHNGVARYLFALGREQVLPSTLSRVGTRSGGPVAGSVAQTVVALVVVLVFVIAGADPVLELFTWLSGMAAVGVILLMAGTSAAVVGFFRRFDHEASAWQRSIAPIAATVVLVALVVLLVANFDTLVGTAPGSALRWILPALVGIAALAGAAWAAYLRSSRPDVFEGIGHTALAPSDEDVRPDVAPVLPNLPRRG